MRLPQQRHLWIPLCAMVLLICVAFFAGVEKERSGLYGRFPAPADNLWRMNPSMTLVFVRHWQRAGFWKDSGLLRYVFSDSQNHGDDAYLSYPPAFAIEPYIFSRLKGEPPQLEHVMAVGSANHLISSLAIACFVFFAVSFLSSLWIAAVLGLATAVVVLLIPPAFVYFPFGWWADMAGLPFFALMLALEASAACWASARAKRSLRILQAVIIIGGVCSDWLFYLLVFALALKDFTSRPRRWRWELYAFPLLYISIHLGMIAKTNAWANLSAKLSLRIGLKGGEEGWVSTSHLLYQGLQSGFGETWHVLHLLSLLSLPLVSAAFLFRSRLNEQWRSLVENIFLILLPIHLHAYVLHQHYAGHPYNGVKFALLLPAIVFGLLPAMLLLLLKRWRISGGIVLAIALVAAASFARECFESSRTFLAAPMNIDRVLEDRCRLVYLNAQPNEVSFSPDFATVDFLAKEGKPLSPKVNDWARPACGRTVFFAPTPAEVLAVLRELAWKYMVLGANNRFQLWTVGAPAKAWAPFLVVGSGRKLGEELQVHELSGDVLHSRL